MKTSFTAIKILSVILMLWTNAALATVYYVGGAGAAPGNPGTSVLPFVTIQQAANVAVNGDIVKIRTGVYREKITPANSGVTFQPDDGADVTISGLDVIADNAWTLVPNKSYYEATVTLPNSSNFKEIIDPSTEILANQVFKDGIMQIQARWPNIASVEEMFDKSKLRKTSASLTINKTTISDPGNTFAANSLVDATVVISGWFLTQTRKINTHTGTSLTYSNLIPLIGAENPGDAEFRKFYYVTNDIDLLDQPGEWHYAVGKLNYYPSAGTPTGIEFKKRSWGFDLRNKSSVKIVGLNFIGCDPVVTSETSAGIEIDNIRAKYINHSILSSNSGQNYDSAALQSGIKLIGNNNVIKNSEIRYAGAMGVWLGEGGRAENNYFDYIAYDGMWGAPVKPWKDKTSQVITKNTSKHTGRGFVELHSSNSTSMDISYNEASYFNMLSEDGGAVYSQDRRNHTGTRIHHNWFHDCGVYFPVGDAYHVPNGIQVTGVYMDQASGPVTVDHNVHWNGLSDHSGDFYAEIYSHYDNPPSTRIVQHKIYNNTFASLPAYGSYVTGVDPDVSKDFQRNNIYRSVIYVGDDATQTRVENSSDVGPGDVTNAIRRLTNPLFVGAGMGGLDFKLQVTSPAINAGTSTNITYTDPAIGAIDIGAYEYGGTDWIPGYTAVPSSTNPVPPATAPLVQLKLNEATGILPVNSGSASSTFSRSTGTPSSSATVPDNVGGPYSFDFGTTVGNYYVESTAAINGLKSLNAFTLTGWVNCKSSTTGNGGNRILSWINNGGDGVDLVYQNDGSLRLGVDGWPDNSPAYSTAGKITTNASAPAGNWVFFAVTYDGVAGQVKYYFGNNANDATLDVLKTYNTQGAVGTTIGKLAVGAFNDASRNVSTYDRIFRGLIDDVNIYGYVLTAQNIVAVQRGVTDITPPTAPSSLTFLSKTSTSVSLSWTASTDNIAVTGYEIYKGGVLAGTSATTTFNVTGLTTGTAYAFTVKAKDASNNLSAASNVLNVTTDGGAASLIWLKFNEATGVTPLNNGSSTATFMRSTTTPASSVNVPAGVGGANSFDFGTTTGNNYVESSSAINDLKGLASFTLTGWLNCRSSAVGNGGNRVISWINNGGNGVDLVYQNDGSLRLGVNGWPDSSPAVSSVNKITTNAAAPAANWVYFAVTYQSSNGQVLFYFGNNATDATLSNTTSYPGQGPVGTSIGKLAIGAFNDATRNVTTYDRMFRGLIDDIQIFGSVLSASNIVAVQRSGDLIPPTAPTSLASPSKTSTTINLTWTASTDNVAVTGYEIYNGAALLTSTPVVTSYTVTGLAAGTAYSLTVKAKDAANNLSTASNIVNVTTNAALIPLIKLKFNEATGVAPANSGSLSSAFTRSTTTPASSATAPTGVGGGNSFDFNTTTGNYYVESSAVINGLKSLASFTLTGWINNKSSVEGNGGNRIITWGNNGGNGADLVYRNDGSISLGVNEWPDNTPARSTAGKITTNASAPASNWVYFAVTYSSTTGQAIFYFGNNTTDATLDVTRTYNPGAVGTTIGKLAVGHFNDATRGASTYDRMLRGLIDDVQIYGTVLTLADIVSVQRGTGGNPGGRLAVSEPIQTTESNDVDISGVKVEQNYPNPFTGQTTIRMFIPSDVRDASFQMFDPITHFHREAGIEDRGDVAVSIEGRDLKSGIYIYMLKIDGRVVGIKKMVVVK